MTKQIVFAVIMFAITGNNIIAMKNDSYPWDEMTCHRPSGHWQVTHHNQFKETSKEDQREPWHQYTSYIAEPLCTVSNLPFFLVAYAVKDSNPLSAAALTFAGSASAISHAVPYQFLNNIDKIGALASAAAVAYDSDIYTISGFLSALHNQKKLAALATIGAIKLTDMYVARSKQIVKNSNGLLSPKMVIQRKTGHVWIHVLWHFLAAWTAYTVLTTS